MKNIILASASKRRTDILSSCGIKHTVAVSSAKEITRSKKHVSYVVKKNAENKAREISERRNNAIIIGADTLVSHKGDIIGKPNSENEAKMLLKRFMGEKIEVYTGLCVISVSEKGKKKVTGFEKSVIKVAKINKRDREKCFKLLAPYDKAGGFSIEGAGSMIFDDISGSYFNILGLPMMKLRGLFNKIGEDIFDYAR